ncbi:MAG TPA: amidohydrolase, partial [Balneolaceae bacterium]|nr:amidohydrolase [Balneolaceae bacterium]
MDLSRIKNLAEEGLPEMTKIRRHLHRHPEVSYKEFETTDFIISRLEELGIPVERPLETGCVGIIEGGKSSDRVVALRADIDALAMEEEGDAKAEFLSENKGAAHCCGHDAHTANLLGTARILMECRDEIEGKVVLIFQPGEEKLPGGGRLLCESGFLQEQGVDVIYGLHSLPSLPPGHIALREGPLMARPDEFEIDVIGEGGHAATPHDAIDPIVLAAEIVTQLQTIVSRSVNPTEPAVVTIGKIEGGSTFNVIPEKVSLKGTVRTFSEETAMLIKKRMHDIVKGVTDGAGADYEFRFNEGYPALINTPEATDTVINTASRIIGEQNVHVMDKPIMGGEDFAFYLQEFP